jgi:hypothetical protein
MFGTDLTLADPRLRRPNFRGAKDDDAFNAEAFLEGLLVSVAIMVPLWAFALLWVLR